MSDDLVSRVRKELDELLTGLRKQLEDKTRSSPEAWKLLRDANKQVGQLRAALTQATLEIERLAGELARRKPPDDDGVPEMVPVVPPKRPRGGASAFASRRDESGESTPDVQNKARTVPETDEAVSDPRGRTTIN